MARLCAVLLVCGFQAQAQLPAPKLDRARSSTDHWHNDDGSTRYNFEVAAGPSSGVGPTRRYQTFGGVAAAGAGINFNRTFTLQARGEYDKFGVPGSLLYAVAQKDGKVEVVSGTLNGIVRFGEGPHLRPYVTLGGGYYRRVTTFTDTIDTGNGSSAQATTGQFHMDTYGGSAGVGFEWKGSFYSNMKLFAEARYNFVRGQKSHSTSGAGYDLNSRNFQYIPVLVGFRW